MQCYNSISNLDKTYLGSHSSTNWLISNDSLKRSLAGRAVGGIQKTFIQTIFAKVVTTHCPHRICNSIEAYRAVFCVKVSACAIKVSLKPLLNIVTNLTCLLLVLLLWPWLICYSSAMTKCVSLTTSSCNSLRETH